MELKSSIMDEGAIYRALTRIAHEIVERNDNTNQICIIGIVRRGVALAEILSEKLIALGVEVKTGKLDISLYRDDLSADQQDMPTLNKTEIDFDINGQTVVMVDDVLYTGRTARAAMDALIELGRPSKIQLAALVDRGHRELPIRADYVGKNIPTSKNEVVVVNVPPFDSETEVKLYNR